MGFSCNDVLSFTESEDGSSVIVKREKVCDNCKTGAARKLGKATESITLFDFLNSLSPEQQRSALVHLSIRLADMKGGAADG